MFLVYSRDQLISFEKAGAPVMWVDNFSVDRPIAYLRGIEVYESEKLPTLEDKGDDNN